MYLDVLLLRCGDGEYAIGNLLKTAGEKPQVKNGAYVLVLHFLMRFRHYVHDRRRCHMAPRGGIAGHEAIPRQVEVSLESRVVVVRFPIHGGTPKRPGDRTTDRSPAARR